MAYDQEEMQKLQKQYPNTGPIIGPFLDKITSTKAQIQNPYQNAGGGAAGVGAVVGSAGKTVLDDYNRYFNTFIGDPVRAYGGIGKDFVKGVFSSSSADPVATTAQSTESATKLPIAKTTKGAPFQQQPTASSSLPKPVDWQSKLPPGMMNEPALPMVDAMAAYGKLPSVQQTPASASKAYADALMGSAKALPGQPIPVTKEAGIRDQLGVDGFSKLNSLPENQDPRTGTSYLGPNDIYVKERLGTPQEYTAAVQANQNATARGQQVGLEQSFGAKGYAPNAATQSGMEKGGAITEYAVPGKGTATFYGQRQGGGTLSVLGGRTAEEQQAIDERVKQIDSQTAAMRGLRNAGRLAQGGITVEEEQQQNAMAAMMNRLAPPPDMRGFEERQKALMSQLSSAKDIRGFGKSRQRKDAIEAAQIGLAQLANEQQALNQAHGQRQQLASQVMQNQSEQARAEQAALAAQKKAMLEQQQWQTTEEREASDSAANRYYQGQQLRQGDARIALDAAKDARASKENYGVPPEMAKNFFTTGMGKNGEETKIFNAKAASAYYPLAPVGKEPIMPYQPYVTDEGFIMFDENGKRISPVGPAAKR